MSSRHTCIIAIDCGASFVKGCCIQNGTIVSKKQLQAPGMLNERNFLTPKRIQILVDLVRKLIIELAGKNKCILLCISNEMHGFLLAHEDGIAYTDYISWQTELGNAEVNGKTALMLLEDRVSPDEIKHTGMGLRAGLPSCNLLFLSEKKLFNGREERLVFYTLGDYLLKALSGIEPMIHVTNAAATGLYDLRSEDWNWKLISAVGGNELRFLQIGTRPIEFELDGIAICALPTIGDQQAALLGAGLQDEETLSFNLGTGAQVSKLVRAPEMVSNCQIRPYFGGTYLRTIPHIPSGRAINVYFRFIKNILDCFEIHVEDDRIWNVIKLVEATAENTELSCDLSFFENAITDKTKGCLENIGEYTLTMGNLFRAILRQMANNFTSAADIIEMDHSRIRKILFSGGVARRIEPLRRYILEHYPQPLEVQVATDETLLGLYQYGEYANRP